MGLALYRDCRFVNCRIMETMPSNTYGKVIDCDLVNVIVLDPVAFIECTINETNEMISKEDLAGKMKTRWAR